jgi:hypothetical protein
MHDGSGEGDCQLNLMAPLPLRFMALVKIERWSTCPFM